MEDRFLTLKLMEAVSDELEAAGFAHVVTRHHIDPKWRRECRPQRPEMEPVSWSISVTDHLLPLPEIKALVEICERHNLVVWWDAWARDDDRTLYLKVGPEFVSRQFVVPNR